MTALTDNQRYHLILADIAMAAAIRAYDPGYALGTGEAGYAPGAVRDGWLAGATNPGLRRRVTALANAGVGSLQELPAEKLAAAAAGTGIPVTPDLAARIADHFATKRDAVLTYDR